MRRSLVALVAIAAIALLLTGARPVSAQWIPNESEWGWQASTLDEDMIGGNYTLVGWNVDFIDLWIEVAAYVDSEYVAGDGFATVAGSGDASQTWIYEGGSSPTDLQVNLSQEASASVVVRTHYTDSEATGSAANKCTRGSYIASAEIPSILVSGTSGSDQGYDPEVNTIGTQTFVGSSGTVIISVTDFTGSAHSTVDNEGYAESLATASLIITQ